MLKAVAEAKEAAVQDGLQSASEASKSKQEQVLAANATAELAQARPANHTFGTFPYSQLNLCNAQSRHGPASEGF